MPADELHDIEGTEVAVYYIPDVRNRYNPEEDVVVLDEELKEWPLAHEVIKQHELDHAKAENSTALGLLTYELRTDFCRYFSSDPEWEAVRDYLQAQNKPTNLRIWLKSNCVNHLRSVWTAAMIPLHGCYQAMIRGKTLLQRVGRG